jgi:hypothetical protein
MVAAVDAAAAHFAGKSARRRAGFGFFKERGVAVFEIFQFNARDFLADEAFDGINVRRVLGDHDGEGVAARLGAAGAADAMDVIFGMLRHVVIDDVTDVGDVQPARGDVGGDEDFVFALAKTLQGLFAFSLRAVGMQHGDGVVGALEQSGDAVRAVFRAAENEDGIVIHALEQFEQQVSFLRVGNGIDDVLDGFRRRAARADLDGFGTVHRPLNERFDLRRNGGGKQRRVPRARAFFHDVPHVGQKSHVEHPVSFVEDEKLNLVQTQRALLQMIEQSSGRGDDSVGAGFQFVVLFSVTDAAEDDGGFQIGETRIIADGRFDLRGEFARRFENEHARTGRVRAELRENGQRERRGLAGAGLRTADDVLAGEDQRNGAQLDGRRLDVTHRLDAFENFLGKSECGKTHGWKSITKPSRRKQFDLAVPQPFQRAMGFRLE